MVTDETGSFVFHVSTLVDGYVIRLTARGNALCDLAYGEHSGSVAGLVQPLDANSGPVVGLRLYVQAQRGEACT